jgi:hypothetical protein
MLVLKFKILVFTLPRCGYPLGMSQTFIYYSYITRLSLIYKMVKTRHNSARRNNKEQIIRNFNLSDRNISNGGAYA